MLINDAIEQFLTEIEIEQRSRAHLIKTRWHLAHFAQVHGFEDARSIKALTLARYMSGLVKEDGTPYAPATLNGFTSALKALFGYLLQAGEIDSDPTTRLKRKRVRPRSGRVAGQDAVTAVRAALPALLASRSYAPADVRDALIVSLSCDSGGRRGELHQVTVEAARRALARPVNIDGGACVYHLETAGKTGPAQLRFFSLTADILRIWLRIRPTSSSAMLFTSLRDGRHVHVMTITAAFKRICQFAGVPPILSHAIRHRRITEVMTASDAEVARAYANHADVRTTLAHYRHLADGEVDAVAAKTAVPADDDMRRLFGLN